MKPTKKLPLFCITGASCVGKSTVCAELFRDETAYIVLESDILWHDVYNTPQDDYQAYRRVWMRMCANISQIGMPCVLCGCCTPKQFEALQERKLFSEVHFLAIVCDDDTMRHRMQHGRQVSDLNYIESSVNFNRWLRENHGLTEPEMTLLDTTAMTPRQAADEVDSWIRKNLK